MRKWLRRIRGALGMGFTWAAAWFAVGSVPRWVFGVSTDLPLPLLFGALGFIAGVTFSGLLVLTEGRRRLDQLSLPRVAGWGAIGGVLLSALFVSGASLGWGEVLAISATFALASAVSASGSLALARRAVRRELPASRGQSRALDVRSLTVRLTHRRRECAPALALSVATRRAARAPSSGAVQRLHRRWCARRTRPTDARATRRPRAAA